MQNGEFSVFYLKRTFLCAIMMQTGAEIRSAPVKCDLFKRVSSIYVRIILCYEHGGACVVLG